LDNGRSSLELVGGALLFLGLGSRIIALPLTIDMLVAYITADRAALFSIFSDPGKFYASDAYTFLVASVLILIFGPGKISVDYAIGYPWRWPSRSRPAFHRKQVCTALSSPVSRSLLWEAPPRRSVVSLARL
jgi:hypothetical protein